MVVRLRSAAQMHRWYKITLGNSFSHVNTTHKYVREGNFNCAKYSFLISQSIVDTAWKIGVMGKILLDVISQG